MKTIITNIAILSVALVCAGCDPGPRSSHRLSSIHKPHKEKVEVFREHQSDDTYLYWYVFEMNTRSGPVYYYSSSSTPVSNFSSMSFARSNGSLPISVQQSIAKSTPEPEQEVEPEAEPADVVAEEVSGEEVGEPGDPGVDAADSSSADSSSSDSGGGDGGGE